MVEDLNQQLESMHAMFGKISCGSYEVKGSIDGAKSEVDARMLELERQLQDTRKERDRLKLQFIQMQDEVSQLRCVQQKQYFVALLDFRKSRFCNLSTLESAESFLNMSSQRRSEIVGGKGQCSGSIVRI